MKSIWKATYVGNEIRIENTWFHGERLYVNDQLQDEQGNICNALLTGHLFDGDTRKNIKANIFSFFFGVKCTLFVDNNLVKLTQVK
ncbi:hypothetical protein CAPN004_13110 [Capnocytophaga cynodegmi]|uniref:hypothetical protein n=1 Tax=Capnocytophaga cynodegmi TaxID=28189 RepID=UPI001AD13497|nr:hypothetical protein [Capnocytophaga cynodegmi]GIM52281.1 hypothetical protein CAPN004_13110 [Capnocytophaga cynodegmi]